MRAKRLRAGRSVGLPIHLIGPHLGRGQVSASGHVIRKRCPSLGRRLIEPYAPCIAKAYGSDLACLRTCGQGCDVYNFNTDDISPKDRFEYWREARSRDLFGVTIELARERQADFSGSIVAEEIGGAVVARMRALPYTISRTKADIARKPGNSITIKRQVRGVGVLELGTGDIQKVGQGEITFGHSDMPYAAFPDGTDAFDYQMLRIPLTNDIAPNANVDKLRATTSGQMRSFARPISALFNALMSPRGKLADPASAVTHIAWLFLLERGQLELSNGRSALRAGLYHAALEVLTRDLHKFSLSPGTVANELGLSLRQLHLLFEPSGRSFSRTLADIRMSRSFELFDTRPLLSILEISFACGIESQATFYRLFRDAFNMTPGDRRKQSLRK